MSKDSSLSTWVYQASPSRESVEKDRRYRKTREYYTPALRQGMMVGLEHLENSPAPVLCSYCERAVITETKVKRTSFQKFYIAWASVFSFGLLLFPFLSLVKTTLHVCPACQGALAVSGEQQTTKVLKSYDPGAPTKDPTRPVGDESFGEPRNARTIVKGGQFPFQVLNVHYGSGAMNLNSGAGMQHNNTINDGKNNTQYNAERQDWSV